MSVYNDIWHIVDPSERHVPAFYTSNIEDIVAAFHRAAEYFW
jgi:hypothetical protein